jgi:uncharacterized membrane protein
MTVKEVVLAAAEMVGVGDAVKIYLDGDKSQGGKECEALLRCFNFIQNELALDYFPLVAEDVVSNPTGRIKYVQLSKAAVRILSVKDETERSVQYKLFPSFLESQVGDLTVRYTYTPSEKTVSGDVEASMVVSLRLIAYGVAAEYCFSVGLYEEGEAWNKKYKDALVGAYALQPAKVMRSRRWQ